MPNYGVTLYYHASLYLEVRGDSKEEALAEAKTVAAELPIVVEVGDTLVLDQEDYDIEELKEEVPDA